MASVPDRPWLLYAYPWMLFPRRVIIYLKEKKIPSSLVEVVKVSNTQNVNAVPPGYPPRPEGSLPILVIPALDDDQPIHIRQSMAIMNYLEELCDSGSHGFPKSSYSMRGNTPLERARIIELQTLSEELTTMWNPVRLFGTGAGPFSRPDAAKKSLRWVGRALKTIDGLLQDRDVSILRKGGEVNMGDIVLYQFLDFVHDCYGRDLTEGSGETVKDVYGREVEETYPRLKMFFEAFRTRESSVRDEELGEVPGAEAKAAMTKWADGL